MKIKPIVLLVTAILCSWYSFSNQAHAQATSDFPFGKRWEGKNYGKTDGWFSSGILIAHRPTPGTELVGPKNRVIYGLETRYHFNSRVAFFAGVHFGGQTEPLQWSNATDSGTTSEYTETEIDHVYRETSWQTGVDFGLIESKYFHVQAGPRLGVQLSTASIEGDIFQRYDYASDVPDDVSSLGLFSGVVVRPGVFPLPFVEVGLHLQADYTVGSAMSGFGREVGGYSVVHF